MGTLVSAQLALYACDGRDEHVAELFDTSRNGLGVCLRCAGSACVRPVPRRFRKRRPFDGSEACVWSD